MYKYRRYKKRSNYRRGLSSYNIATKTNARAQSKQIYYLNKKINRIQRLTKPEIVINERQSAAITQPTNSIPWKYGNISLNYIAPNLGSGVTGVNTELDADTANNFARLQSFVLYGNWQYTAVNSTSVPETLRIVIVQLKTSRTVLLNPSDIFSGDGSGVQNPFIQVYGPLQKGLARTCKVLSDKRYQLNFQKPCVTIKTKLKYLLNYYRDENSSESGSSEDYPKGSIMVFKAFYTPAEAISSNLQLYSKLAYTDA